MLFSYFTYHCETITWYFFLFLIWNESIIWSDTFLNPNVKMVWSIFDQFKILKCCSPVDHQLFHKYFIKYFYVWGNHCTDNEWSVQNPRKVSFRTLFFILLSFCLAALCSFPLRIYLRISVFRKKVIWILIYVIIESKMVCIYINTIK